ncbi:hypothetical protein ACFTUC_03410 [Streptomyces sp. NPDC056944]|uniref:hypothetical protein n=1 Tax=Streptomyces sp. NPDC056944 TaxID=3345972 RepID=UPI0036442F0E
MNTSTESDPEPKDQATPEDGQGVPVVEKVKGFVKRNGPRILAIGGTVLAVVAAASAARQSGEQGVVEGAEDLGESPEPPPGEDSKRAQHQVKGALVDLGGRQASPQAQENYRRDVGDDLPPGKTYRPPHSRGGQSSEGSEPDA